MTRARIVILISGGGSNLQTLIDATTAPDCPYGIVKVISNRPNAGGLDRANVAGIANEAIDHRAFPDRQSFEAVLAEAIEVATPDFIVCAGFMRVLTETFVARFDGKMINIHPSLLPNFRGLHTHARALEAGVAFAGCSVHWVSAGVDEGAIIGQAIVPVLPGDIPDSLAARVLGQEHKLYPVCVAAVASRRAILRAGRNYVDGKPGAIAVVDHSAFDLVPREVTAPPA
jgi:phosphoribosylglycinamide formyltransferase 1